MLKPLDFKLISIKLPINFTKPIFTIKLQLQKIKAHASISNLFASPLKQIDNGLQNLQLMKTDKT